MFETKHILLLIVFISSKALLKDAEEITFYGKNQSTSNKNYVSQAPLKSNLEVEIKGHNINSTNKKDSDGRAIFIVEPETTFSIKIDVGSSSKVNLKNIEIENYEGFSFQRSASSSFFSGINGEKSWKQSKEFSFTSPSESGNYILGPFNIETNEESIQKEAMIIQVKELSYEQASARPCYAILETESNTPFIMQEFKIRLKVFLKENEIFQPEPQIKSMPNFEKKDLGKEESVEVINGQNYKVETYSYLVTPVKTGKLEIPPIGVSYLSKQVVHSPFWGSVEIPKEGFVRSNRLHLDVLEIPENKKNVVAVGKFNSIKLETNTSAANSNEPIVLKLIIEGSGNFDQISHPKLNLDKKIKHYNSKEDLNFEKKIKTFEYILQIPFKGIYKIPKQEFTFFNPNTKKYETIFSNSLDIELENSENPTNAGSNPNNISSNKNDNLEKKNLVQQDDNFIQTKKHNFFFRLIPKKMSKSVFYLLIFLTLFSNLSLALKERIYKWLKKKYIAKATIKELVQIKNTSEFFKALEIFNNYLVYKFDIKESELSNEKINLIIKKLNFDNNSINDFKKTFQAAYRMTFANDNIENEDKKETIDQLILWVKKIDFKANSFLGSKKNA